MTFNLSICLWTKCLSFTVTIQFLTTVIIVCLLGTMIPESPPWWSQCGTAASGWLNSTHPTQVLNISNRMVPMWDSCLWLVKLYSSYPGTIYLHKDGLNVGQLPLAGKTLLFQVLIFTWMVPIWNSCLWMVKLISYRLYQKGIIYGSIKHNLSPLHKEGGDNGCY